MPARRLPSGIAAATPAEVAPITRARISGGMRRYSADR